MGRAGGVGTGRGSRTAALCFGSRTKSQPFSPLSTLGVFRALPGVAASARDLMGSAEPEARVSAPIRTHRPSFFTRRTMRNISATFLATAVLILPLSLNHPGRRSPPFALSRPRRCLPHSNSHSTRWPRRQTSAFTGVPGVAVGATSPLRLTMASDTAVAAVQDLRLAACLPEADRAAREG